MKKNVILAIAAMAIMAIAMAFVSCKKDETKNKLVQTNQSETFNTLQIEDMNAYLKDFKQRMLTSNKGESETMNLEDAAWHLSSLANYDFGHTNVELDDIRFDTLYSYIMVKDGAVELSDMAIAYEDISNAIDKLFHGLYLENKHFRFIDIEISDQGEVTISTITTFSNPGKWHYFDDDSFCDLYFPDNTSYPANGSAVTTLTTLFNLILGHSTEPDSTGRVYFVKTADYDFHYNDWPEDIDEYCPNTEHSRLYCSGNVYNWPIPKDHMCYYLDSYLGLAHDYANGIHRTVIDGTVIFLSASNNQEGSTVQQCGNHLLHVNFGMGVGYIGGGGTDY